NDSPAEVDQEPVTEVLNPITEEVVSFPTSYSDNSEITNPEPEKNNQISNLPAPILLGASYANGNKVVVGRLEGSDEKEIVIPEDQLQYYTVNVYYTNSTDIANEAGDKTELIGTTTLQ